MNSQNISETTVVERNSLQNNIYKGKEPTTSQKLIALKVWLNNALTDSPPLRLHFTKSDGTERAIYCSANPRIVEKFPKPSSKHKNIIHAFNLETEQWESINVNRFLLIEFVGETIV